MNLLNVLRDLTDVAAAQQRVDEYKDAYDNVVAELRDRNHRLGVLEQREEAMQSVLAAPCPMCRELEGERDDALLRLDAEIATRVWIEGTFMGGKTA